MKKKSSNKIPVPLPTHEQIRKAFEVLREEETHWYQLLYINGLTSPGGAPLVVERAYRMDGEMLSMMPHIMIYPSPNLAVIRGRAAEMYTDAGVDYCKRIAMRYGFGIDENDTDETVLKKAGMVWDGMNDGMKKPIKPYACCSWAKVRRCNCAASFSCPIHGNTCVGSHD